jgi:excinuclease UvrABC nuclease subunit
MPKIRIENRDFYNQVPELPGIYRIYSIDGNDNPHPLTRVLGTDSDGVLYIGKSKNLRERVRMLWRVLQPNYGATAHTFGINYKSLEVIRNAFPYETLAIEYETNEDPKEYEKVQIEIYRQIYGEVPPLNGSK